MLATTLPIFLAISVLSWHRYAMKFKSVRCSFYLPSFFFATSALVALSGAACGGKVLTETPTGQEDSGNVSLNDGSTSSDVGIDAPTSGNHNPDSGNTTDGGSATPPDGGSATPPDGGGVTPTDGGGAPPDGGAWFDADTDATMLDAETPDSSTSPDAEVDAGIDGGGVKCPDAPCEGTDQCCAELVGTSLVLSCKQTCGGAVLSCDGSEDCPAGESCCAEVQTSGSSFPACTVESSKSSCSASCSNSLQPSCTTQTVQLCQQASDCSNQPGTLCCSTTLTSAPLQFCAPSFVTMLPGGGFNCGN